MSVNKLACSLSRLACLVGIITSNVLIPGGALCKLDLSIPSNASAMLFLRDLAWLTTGDAPKTYNDARHDLTLKITRVAKIVEHILHRRRHENLSDEEADNLQSAALAELQHTIAAALRLRQQAVALGLWIEEAETMDTGEGSASPDAADMAALTTPVQPMNEDVRRHDAREEARAPRPLSATGLAKLDAVMESCGKAKEAADETLLVCMTTDRNVRAAVLLALQQSRLLGILFSFFVQDIEAAARALPEIKRTVALIAATAPTQPQQADLAYVRKLMAKISLGVSTVANAELLDQVSQGQKGS